MFYRCYKNLGDTFTEDLRFLSQTSFTIFYRLSTFHQNGERKQKGIRLCNMFQFPHKFWFGQWSVFPVKYFIILFNFQCIHWEKKLPILNSSKNYFVKVELEFIPCLHFWYLDCNFFVFFFIIHHYWSEIVIFQDIENNFHIRWNSTQLFFVH